LDGLLRLLAGRAGREFQQGSKCLGHPLRVSRVALGDRQAEVAKISLGRTRRSRTALLLKPGERELAQVFCREVSEFKGLPLGAGSRSKLPEPDQAEGLSKVGSGKPVNFWRSGPMLTAVCQDLEKPDCFFGLKF